MLADRGSGHWRDAESCSDKRRGRIPLYVRVASVMRHRIESSYWAEGAKIPTIEELKREFAVARVTIRQAIQLLQKDGLLAARQGRGTFVCAEPKNIRWINLSNDFDSMVASIRKNVLKHIDVQENVPVPLLTKGEGRAAAAYAFLRSVQYNNGAPFSVVNAYIDKDIFHRHRGRFTRGAALAQMVETEVVRLLHAHQTLTIGVASPETAELLKIALGEPTLDCRLVLENEDGIAAYIGHIHYNRSCFAIRNDLLVGRRPSLGHCPVEHGSAHQA